jgi:hypothetical protein
MTAVCISVSIRRRGSFGGSAARAPIAAHERNTQANPASVAANDVFFMTGLPVQDIRKLIHESREDGKMDLDFKKIVDALENC